MLLARKVMTRTFTLLRRGRLLLISAALSLPISFIASLAFLYAIGRRDSFRVLAASSLIGLILLAWPVAWVLSRFIRRPWIKSAASYWPYYVLACILSIVAGYQAWIHFPPAGFNQPHAAYNVMISSEAGTTGDICLLQVRDNHGRSIRPGANSVSSVAVSGDWTQKAGSCSYFSQGSTPGSLVIRYAGQFDEVLSFQFRQTQSGGTVLIRVNDQNAVRRNLHADVDRDLIVSVTMDSGELLVWNAVGSVSWGAAFLGLLILLAVVLSYAERKSWYARGLTGIRSYISRGTTAVTTSTAGPNDLLLSSRTQAAVERIERLAADPLTYLAIAALLLFWPVTSRASSDVAYYLSLAKNLYHGNGYVNTDLSAAIYRGPVFPWLISVSYAIFGMSFRSALVVERLFWLLSILIAYLLGARIFNRRVGLLAALFVLFAGVINEVYSSIWTDGPLASLVLVVQFTCWHVFQKQRGTKWYVLIGILLGLAYLLKQTALFIVPLPLLTWALFSDYRTSQNFLRLLVCYLTFSVFFIGWMVYVYWSGGSQGQVLMDLSLGISFLSYIGRSITNFIGGGFAAHGSTPGSQSVLSPLQIIRAYYGTHIAPYFRPAILFPVTLAYTAYQALWRRSRPDIFLGLGLLLFSSLIPIQVVTNFGPRVDLYLYIIILILVAAMLDRILHALPKPISIVLTPLAVVAVIWMEIQYSPPLQLFTPRLFNQPLKYYADYLPTAVWIKNNVRPDDKIIMELRDSEILDSLMSSNRHFKLLNTCVGELSFFPAQRCTPPYISFWIYKGVTDPDAPRDALFAISEPSFLSSIESGDVKYVIVTPRVYSLYFYLKVHPAFQEVAKLGDNVVFRVISPVRPISAYPNVKWDTCIGQGNSRIPQEPPGGEAGGVRGQAPRPNHAVDGPVGAGFEPF